MMMMRSARRSIVVIGLLICSSHRPHHDHQKHSVHVEAFRTTNIASGGVASPQQRRGRHQGDARWRSSPLSVADDRNNFLDHVEDENDDNVLHREQCHRRGRGSNRRRFRSLRSGVRALFRKKLRSGQGDDEEDDKNSKSKRYRSILKPFGWAALTTMPFWIDSGILPTSSLLSSSTSSSSSSSLTRVAHASAPIVIVPTVEIDIEGDALRRAEEEYEQQDRDEREQMREKSLEILRKDGTKAKEEFEAKFWKERTEKGKQLQVQMQQKKRELLDRGVCPFVSKEGYREMFLVRTGIDLADYPSTAWNEEKLNRAKLGVDKEEEMQRRLQREIIKLIVQNLDLQEIDPVDYFDKHQEDTEEILALNPIYAQRKLLLIRENIEKYGSFEKPRPGQPSVKDRLANDPEWQARLAKREEEKARAARGEDDDPAAAKAKAKAEAKAKAAKEKAQREEEKAKMKAAKAEAKAKEQAEKQMAKEQAKAAKEKAKKEKEEAKQAAKAAKAAAVAAAAAAAATTAAAAQSAAGSLVEGAGKAAVEGLSGSSGDNTEITAPAIESDGAAAGGDDISAPTEDGDRSTDSAAAAEADESSSKAVSPKSTSSANKIPIVPISAFLVAAGGGRYMVNVMRQRAAENEAERQRQFKLIMGDIAETSPGKDEDDDDADDKAVDKEEDGDKVDDDDKGLEGLLDMDSGATTSDPTTASGDAADAGKTPATPSSTATATADEADTTTATKPKKAKKAKVGGLKSMFSRKSGNDRETDLTVLVTGDAKAPEVASLLAKLLSYGAPGRFPQVAALSGEMPFAVSKEGAGDGNDGSKDVFVLDKAKEMLENACSKAGLTAAEGAEIFANVANCMIVDIVDLASSTLKEESKVTFEALNVVLDFMNHAATLYDSVAEDVIITPVTYQGTLGRGKLEQLFGVYASEGMMKMEEGMQGRVDLLRDVFAIPEKKAEGIIVKQTQRTMMKMMQSPEGMEDMQKLLGGMMGGEGAAGMDALASMMGGADGSGGDGPSIEELKKMLTQVKQMKDAGAISPEEMEMVRKQFKENFGSSIDDVVQQAGMQGSDGALPKEDRELLELMKDIMEG